MLELLLHEEPVQIREFKLKTQRHSAGSYTLELRDYGTVLRSGWGSEPSRSTWKSCIIILPMNDLAYMYVYIILHYFM